MSDLFAATPAQSRSPDSEREIPPAFGTPAWDRCRCGRWATLHFPLAGGLRRCQRCARAEGRMAAVAEGPSS